MVNRAKTSPTTQEYQRQASPVKASHTNMACTPTKRPAVKLTISVTTDAGTPSCVVQEPCLTNVSFTVTTGTRSTVANQANTGAQMPTWVAHNQSQVQLKPQVQLAQAAAAAAVTRLNQASIDQLAFSDHHSHHIAGIPKKFKFRSRTKRC